VVLRVSSRSSVAFIYFVNLPALNLNEEQHKNTPLATPLWWRIVSVVRAAVEKELVYRGCAIDRLGELTGGRAIAGIVSGSLFTVAQEGMGAPAHRRIRRSDADGALFVETELVGEYDRARTHRGRGSPCRLHREKLKFA
jgi:hypothetical protein